jgi:hypothetical protein
VGYFPTKKTETIDLETVVMIMIKILRKKALIITMMMMDNSEDD